MESYIENWRRMFDREDLAAFIGGAAQRIVDRFKSCIMPEGVFSDIEEYRGQMVRDVWKDMLQACQDDSVSVTAFDREKFWTLLKARGCTQKNLKRSHRDIFLALENGEYSIDMRINCFEAIDRRTKADLFPLGAKITTLREEGAADFIFMFDRFIPQIREGIDEGYLEMKAAFEAETLRHKRIQSMVKILMQGRGIDYKCDIVGDKITLEFQRIVFTKVEQTVREDQLEGFLSTIPELMETTAPRVTGGERISRSAQAFSYRDEVYDTLKEEKDWNRK